MTSPVESFAETGLLTIDRIFDPAFITELHDEYRRQYAALGAVLPMRVGKGRIQLPVEMAGPFLDPNLFAHPLLATMLGWWLTADYLIDSLTFVTALPGAPDQKLHRDNVSLFPGAPAFDQAIPPYAVTLAIPLVDLTPDTGTTRLVPRSLGLELDEAKARAETDAELPYLQKGGCFVMDYRLWHQGTANRSSDQRPIVYIVYARPWFTDDANFREHPRATIDAAAYAQIPAKHRALFRRVAGEHAAA